MSFVKYTQPSVEQKKIDVELQLPKISQSSTSKDLPFLRTEDLPEEVLKKKIVDTAELLSDRVQRVQQQTRALMVGRTENKTREDKSSQEPKKTGVLSKPSAKSLLEMNPSIDGLKDFAFSKSDFQSFPSLRPVLQSRIGRELPDHIAIGEITALNVDRFTYSSFFLRFEDIFRHRWEQYVQEAISRTPSAVFSKALDPRWRTEIELVLSSQGEVEDVLIFKEAGLKDFDKAVVRALREARMIPHPPKGLINSDDGRIRLRLGFVVKTDAKAIAERY
ncbi:MAG: energy transducer TonB [Bdellovibrio sp.]